MKEIGRRHRPALLGKIFHELKEAAAEGMGFVQEHNATARPSLRFHNCERHSLFRATRQGR
ncbi:hypothetical protein AS9A_0179 [Hoyosella subflava DQS3-9A1]|uniref:Uncharacterized protein n=1 Tax=Hoyosella subflava (strain DSM 45089 / JCM 17490 / NBRC 109087 / DQS3-9A1) TaxID=443218 RepID=F6EF60_HOYSD|nr:hypothetical protein AS9A_0179 [Hoyosella subflava DQS3-9A1]